MIPLLYGQSRNAKAAVDQTAEFLAAKVKALKEIAQRLLEQEKRKNPGQVSEMCDFIKGCQFYCSGTLVWR